MIELYNEYQITIFIWIVCTTDSQRYISFLLEAKLRLIFLPIPYSARSIYISLIPYLSLKQVIQQDFLPYASHKYFFLLYAQLGEIKPNEKLFRFSCSVGLYNSLGVFLFLMRLNLEINYKCDFSRFFHEWFIRYFKSLLRLIPRYHALILMRFVSCNLYR